jgi:glycosyltransferase involved in cell wall biosynthesis
MVLLEKLDSRALPELGWEDSCTVWRGARQMVNTWMAQVAGHELGRGLCHLDLGLLALFDDHVLTEFAYPVLMTCAQLDLAVGAGVQRIVLWDDRSTSCRTIQAYALAHGIPLTVHTDWAKVLHPRRWSEGLTLAHRILQFSLNARIHWQNRYVPTLKSSGFSVLILLGSGIYAASVLPVCERLRNSSKILILPLDHKVDRFLARQGWSSIIPSDYISSARRSVVRREQRRLRRIGQRLLRQPGLLASFRTAQVDLGPVAFPLIQTLLKIRIPMALPALEGLQAIIQRERPQIVLSVPDRQWRAKAAIELGRRANIASLTIQAAVISGHARYDAIFADRAAVMGDLSRRLWKGQGVPGNKLVVTGAPRFDDKYQWDPGAADRIRAALDIPSDKPIITFATQPLAMAVVEQNVNHVVRAAERFLDHQLVFKVHPREDVARYQSLLAKLDACNVVIAQQVDLNALLQASDLVITGFSTVALEAMIFQRPVLIINLTGEPDPVDYVSSGAALGAYAPQDIVKQMERLLTDAEVNAALSENRRRYVMDQLYKVDGQAARRVVELMQRLADRGISDTEGFNDTAGR